ncbi:translation initiation factor SUI1, putative [Babesia caballi]|uniref:Translation initiation factor SUI1, putative n=1 Tax=Babesia caballi TaxID=5871 RepID=A0AAV4LML8_BABCB|nr:translation initiation factor SUI1, putative [Babesia caballi]
MTKSKADAEATAAEAPADDLESLVPVSVEYCSICGMPFDFCDYGDMWESGECRSECARRYPVIFGTTEEVEEQLSSIAAQTASTPRKKKAEARQEVVVQRNVRSKRKVVTSVTGLQHFGVKLEAAAKLFSKHFASGSGVVKGLPGQMDKVDIQGDVEDQVIELILTHYPEITEDNIARTSAKLK